MAQNLLSQSIGFRDSSALNNGTLALNATNTWLAYSFVALESKTLSKVIAYLSAVNGSFAGSDNVCALYASAAGAQATNSFGSLIESRATVTSTPTGAGTVEFTGFTSALTAGVQYFLVFKNAAASPASNFPTYRWTSGIDACHGGSSLVGMFKKHSTDAGSTFTGAVLSTGGFRLEFASSGGYFGIPVEAGSVTGSGDGVYSDRELGALFTTPADAQLRVRAVGMRLTVTGTPTGNPRFRVYEGTSLVATTAEGPQYMSAQHLILPFASTIVLPASAVHRVVLGESTQSDASTNRFNGYEGFVFNDAASKALMPLGGWTKTYWNGSSWTDTDTRAPVIWLIGDFEDLYDSGGSAGGGPLIGGRLIQ